MKYPFPPFELGTKKASTQAAPRFLKSHLPLGYWKDKIDRHPEMKMIMTIRNPKDVLVSYYHFYQKLESLGSFNGTWDDFFDMVKNNQLMYGDYFEFTTEWYKFNQARKNSLVLKYEDMKTDLRGSIEKIATFLEKEVPANIIEQIATRTTFENMMSEAKPGERMKQAGFLRKGVIGNWREYFNEEQNDFVEERIESAFKPIGINFQYE